MADDIDEQIKIQKKVYDILKEGSQDKQIVENYINFLEREKMIMELSNKLKLSTQGKLEFTGHVLNVALTKTNEKLHKKGLLDFMFYLIHRDQDELSYQYPRSVFVKNLTRLFGKITNEIITALEEV